MTQQYVVGELSFLLGRLSPAPDEWLEAAVHDLRVAVEHAPRAELSSLAREAVSLADMICATALEHGDAMGFCQWADASSTLAEFASSANLLP